MRAVRGTHPRSRPSLVVVVVCVFVATIVTAGCSGGRSSSSSGLTSGVRDTPVVVAETSYLADIAQNVAGDRLVVTSLLPQGLDPHSFDPTPRDAAQIAKARAVIINSPGFQPPVDDLIAGAGSDDLVIIDASAGLPGADVDPHFWLDPSKVVAYVDNIRAGLTAIDPAGADEYEANAAAYRQSLQELDSWIVGQVETIPAPRRLLVTNHESFGHFAERYGFTLVGSVFPSPDAGGVPSAKDLGALIEQIRATGAPAIFLETGSSADLADELARETGVKVVSDLYTHSLGEDAPTYLDMMRANVTAIVEALR